MMQSDRYPIKCKTKQDKEDRDMITDKEREDG